jgi:hypothetical protein
MDKRKNKFVVIMDPFMIALDEPCNVNKQPNVTIFRTHADFDNSCFISLDVPLVSNYSLGQSIEDNETFEV